MAEEDLAPQNTKKEKNSSTQSGEEIPLFSKDMIIADVVRYYPEVIEVFFDYGLHCVGCHISGFETIEEGAMGHGITGDNLRNMLLDAVDKIKEARMKREEAHKKPKTEPLSKKDTVQSASISSTSQ